MHKRIIWTLFFAAFILDYFRSRTSEKKSKTLSENIKEKKSKKEIEIDDDIPKPNEKMKAKIDDEELKVTYEHNDEDIEIENNQKKRKNIKNVIDLRIEFCQSWSHRGYFNQVKEHLEATFSNILVTPSDYPLSKTRKILNILVTFFQFGLIIIAFGGDYVKPYLIGIIPEKYLNLIGENKLIVGAGAFLVGNILNNNITNAGAFEIYCNEKMIWSAINNEKKVPNIETIINMIQRYGGKLYRR